MGYRHKTILNILKGMYPKISRLKNKKSLTFFACILFFSQNPRCVGGSTSNTTSSSAPQPKPALDETDAIFTTQWQKEKSIYQGLDLLSCDFDDDNCDRNPEKIRGKLDSIKSFYHRNILNRESPFNQYKYSDSEKNIRSNL